MYLHLLRIVKILPNRLALIIDLAFALENASFYYYKPAVFAEQNTIDIK